MATIAILFVAFLHFLPATIADRDDCADMTVAQCSREQIIRVEFEDVEETVGLENLYAACEASCVTQVFLYQSKPY